ncbi:MAG TPA: PAS domain-containing protein [Stellaceae bacterium]|jgi:hypothetical protein|nr:PAS domain-containing protein [Stellaceae bacterium]
MSESFPANDEMVVSLDAPRDQRLKALHDYWNRLRGDRKMPSRADFDPIDIPHLLPLIVLYAVQQDGGYTVRLVGEEVVQFTGRSATGRPAGATLPPEAAERLTSILAAVCDERAPRFRAGKARWIPEKDYRDFEACFLPLSADGERVNMILSGVSFPRSRA